MLSVRRASLVAAGALALCWAGAGPALATPTAHAWSVLTQPPADEEYHVAYGQNQTVPCSTDDQTEVWITDGGNRVHYTIVGQFYLVVNPGGKYADQTGDMDSWITWYTDEGGNWTRYAHGTGVLSGTVSCGLGFWTCTSQSQIYATPEGGSPIQADHPNNRYFRVVTP